jgi:integral membrane sensor domain MASE1
MRDESTQEIPSDTKTAKRSGRQRRVVPIVLLAAVYFVTGKLGLQLAFVHPSATAVWPPTGIALAAFLLLGYRVWPGIFLGAFSVNITTAGTWATSLGIATGNTLEGLGGAYLINRFAGGLRVFDRPETIFRFVVLAGVVSTAVSATIGVTSLSLGGHADWTNYGYLWWTWWLGDAGGALIVAPLVVLWAVRPRIGWHRRMVLEALFLLLALGSVGYVVFWNVLPIGMEKYPLAFLCIPILLWAAFRFGQRVTVTAIFLLSSIVIWGTLKGLGPFSSDTANESLLLVQSFTIVMALTGMVVAAVVSRDRLENRRRQLLDHLERQAVSVGEELHNEILNTRCGYLATAIDEQDYGEAKKRLDELVTDLRRVMNDLYPNDLEAVGLLGVVRGRLEYVGASLRRQGHPCTVEFACPAEITDETFRHSVRDDWHFVLLYRIVSEAMINVRKHSRATRLGVTVRAPERGVVEIAIWDNGVGNGGPFVENVGLALTRRRAEEIGAEVEYRRTSPAGGTTIIIRLREPSPGLVAVISGMETASPSPVGSRRR